MFQQLKNIDSAFKHIRLFSLVVLLAATVISCYIVYRSYAYVEQMQQQIYIIADGKAIEAFRSNRKDNVAVEGKRHVKDFHQLFFTMAPDEQAIESSMKQAMYLADQSAKRMYDDLKENGYFSKVISSNISQQLHVDSVVIQTNEHPYRFRFYGKQHIIRPLSVTIRTLVTEGYLRDLQIRTDHNPAGLLIERWAILDNHDINTQKR